MRRFSIRLLNGAIVSTLLGDGIAFATRWAAGEETVVYTVPSRRRGLPGVTKRRTLFLLAISKSEYEEAG